MTKPVTISDRILYAPLGMLLWLVAHTPLLLLYPLADIMGRLACNVVRYRRRLVRRNIAQAFPDMERKDLDRTIKKFYRHLADYFVETIKLKGMSDTEMRRRFTFSGTEEIDRLFDEGRDIVLYTSHFGNWEWVTSLGLWTRHQEAVYSHVYLPQQNRWFNDYFHRLRSRYNVSIPNPRVLRQFIEWRREGKRFITGFLSDQRPGWKASTVEVDFLGRPTHFIQGTEELARKFKTAVVWIDTRVQKRGYYHSEVKVICTDASQTPPEWLTREYARLLSTTIRRTPWAYLWSHNRWRDEPNIQTTSPTT